MFKAVTSSITSTTEVRSNESEEQLFSGLNLGRQHHHAPEVTLHLITGHSLVMAFYNARSHWQPGVLRFS